MNRTPADIRQIIPIIRAGLVEPNTGGGTGVVCDPMLFPPVPVAKRDILYFFRAV